MALTQISPRALKPLLPVRPPDGHKGVFGHVLIVAGSRGFTGAAKLAAFGAGRSGVGLVTVATPRPLGDLLGASLTEAMTLMLPSTEDETLAREAIDTVLGFVADKEAAVLGPGISRHPETCKFVLEFVRQCPVPFVVDADGLNCLSTRLDALTDKQAPCIVTPHPGEMARLQGMPTADVQAGRENAARKFARDFDCTVVLKGKHTIVCDEESCAMNPTGNSGLAKGGTGDVLAGIVGGLLAQGMRCFDAASLGVYLHGLAGDLAAEANTERGMTAGDLVEYLPQAWRRLEEGS